MLSELHTASYSLSKHAKCYKLAQTVIFWNSKNRQRPVLVATGRYHPGNSALDLKKRSAQSLYASADVFNKICRMKRIKPHTFKSTSGLFIISSYSKMTS